jgi:hypothetical protein
LGMQYSSQESILENVTSELMILLTSSRLNVLTKS